MDRPDALGRSPDASRGGPDALGRSSDSLGHGPVQPPPPAGPAPEARIREREPVDIIRELLDEVQLLFKKHLELARQELLEALEARLKAAAAGAAAGVMGLFALGFLASALAYGLDVFLPSWVARLIVAILFGAAAAGAALFARKRLVEPPTAPEATIEALKDDKEWARSRLSR